MAVKPILMGGAALLVLGWILHIVGTATSAWSTVSSVELGPWKTCVGSVCESNYDAAGIAVLGGDLEDQLKAVRAMTVLGALCGAVVSGVGVLMAVFSALDKDYHKMMPVASAGAAVVTLIFIIIGVAVWAGEIHPDGADIGYSFALSIVGGRGVLVLVGGLLTYKGGN